MLRPLWMGGGLKLLYDRLLGPTAAVTQVRGRRRGEKKKKKIWWRWSLARNEIAPYWWPLLLFVSSFSLCFRVKTPTETHASPLHLSKPYWLSFNHHTLQSKLSCPFAYCVVMHLHETSAVLCGSSGIITETQTLTSFYCENRRLCCMFVTAASVLRV